MQSFCLQAPFAAAGDQSKAIQALVAGIRAGLTQQTLLGGHWVG